MVITKPRVMFKDFKEAIASIDLKDIHAKLRSKREPARTWEELQWHSVLQWLTLSSMKLKKSKNRTRFSPSQLTRIAGIAEQLFDRHHPLVSAMAGTNNEGRSGGSPTLGRGQQSDGKRFGAKHKAQASGGQDWFHFLYWWVAITRQEVRGKLNSSSRANPRALLRDE